MENKIDHIETRYSEIQIRKMYAKMIAGRGKNDPLSTIAIKHKREAALVEINLAVRELADRWDYFTKKQNYYR